MNTPRRTFTVRTKLAITFATLVLGCSLGTASASTLQAYAFSAGGESTAWTAGPTTYMVNDYPGGQSGKYYVLTPGPGYNVQESTQYYSGSSGPLSASSTMSAGGMGPNGTSTYNGGSQSYAAYGQLGVSANGTFNGLTDSQATAGSEAFATFMDSFTIAGVSGQTGYFVPTFTVDGSWNKTGSAAVQFEMDYQINNNAPLMLYRIQGDTTAGPSLWYNGYVSSLPGLTVGATSVSGSTDVSISPIAFQFNQSFDLTMALFAGVLPYSNGAGTSDFLNTAKLTGITVYDSLGQPLTTFSITSGSGTTYTANGVSAVPVPAAAWLFGSGLLGLIGVARRRGTAQLKA